MGLALLASLSGSSCTSSISTQPDTIVLAQLNSHTLITYTPSFASIGATDTCWLRLSCGCKFVLNLDVSKGDTSAFRLVDIDTMSLDTTPHRIAITCLASTKGDTARYFYSTVDHFGNTKRDTLSLWTSF